MTLQSAGEARLDRLTDGLLLEIEDDQYVVSLHRLAALTSKRANYAPVSRRYLGTTGRHLDIEIQFTLRRSRSGRALMLWTPDGIYTIPLAGVLDVVRGRGRDQATEIARIITDAAQLDDATSKQRGLGRS